MKRSETNKLNEIIESDLPNIKKLAQAFGWVTSRNIEHAEHEIELARAIGDQEAVLRGQIKMKTMKYDRSLFEDCYQRVTRRRAWDE
ncbi:MAG: hypothetical protein JXB07_07895 [Anaerolineae bacterium]|nr:hypothetical protein [Anaerolineae bacterium]